MIVDRHPPVNLFAVIPQRYASFAPDLQALDHLLDDDAIFQRVKGDLARRYHDVVWAQAVAGGGGGRDRQRLPDPGGARAG